MFLLSGYFHFWHPALFYSLFDMLIFQSSFCNKRIITILFVYVAMNNIVQIFFFKFHLHALQIILNCNGIAKLPRKYDKNQ